MTIINSAERLSPLRLGILWLCTIGFQPLSADDSAQPRYRGRTLNQWVAQMQPNRSLDERTRAIEVLPEFGREATPHAATLRKALADREPRIRTAAATALQKMGLEAQPAAIELVRLALYDDDKDAAKAALETLTALGPKGSDAVPELCKALVDRDESVRDAAKSVLTEMNWPEPAVTALIDGLTQSNETVVNACQSPLYLRVSKLSKVHEAAICDLLTHEKAITRDAAHELVDFRKLFASAFTRLAQGLSHSDVNIRRWSATKLRGDSYIPMVKPRADELTAALRDDDLEVRASAAVALTTAERRSPEALAALLAYLRQPPPADSDRDPTVHVVQALLPYGRDAKSAIPELVRMIQTESDRNHDGRQIFAEAALSAIGRDAVPPVQNLLRHARSSVRQRGASILGQIGPDAAPCVPQLITALSDKDPKVQMYAVSALGKIGPAAKAAVEPLIKLADSVPRKEVKPEDRNRYAGTRDDKPAPEKKPAPPTRFTRSLDDSWLLSYTGLSLWQIDKSPRASSIWAAVLDDAEEQPRTTALQVLSYVKDAPEVVVPLAMQMLTRLTKEERAKQTGCCANGGWQQPTEIRKYAILLLAECGSAAHVAIPTLTSIVQPNDDVGSHDWCYVAAVYALFRLDGNAAWLDLLVDRTLPGGVQFQGEDNESKNHLLSLGPHAKPVLPRLVKRYEANAAVMSRDPEEGKARPTWDHDHADKENQRLAELIQAIDPTAAKRLGIQR